MIKTLTCLAAAGTLAAGLGGCGATGLTQSALDITKAESAATIAHLNATEPEFAGMVGSSAGGWAVFPGIFHAHSYLIGYGGGDGLVYAGAGEPVGYSRQVKLGAGLGIGGQYADYVIFFETAEARENFAGWQFSGEAFAAIYGLGASGSQNWSAGRTTFADPRAGGGAAIFVGFDNYSYNDLSAAMGN
ncbi:MAG: hypothetical protein AAFR96_01700 [Planctomycetota bacterium]